MLSRLEKVALRCVLAYHAGMSIAYALHRLNLKPLRSPRV